MSNSLEDNPSVTPACSLTLYQLIQEMSQWRENVEAEAMKAAVLDTESAARFSTAAALASKVSP